MDSILLLHDTKYECRVPEGLHELCKDISHKVLRTQPTNIYHFIADYVDALLITRDNTKVAINVVNNVVESSEFIINTLKSMEVDFKQIAAVAPKLQQTFRDYLDADNESAFRNYRQRMIDNVVNNKIPEQNATINRIESPRNSGDSSKEVKEVITLIKPAYQRYFSNESDKIEYKVDERNEKNVVIKKEFSQLDKNIHASVSFNIIPKYRDKIDVDANQAALIIQRAFRRHRTRRNLSKSKSSMSTNSVVVGAILNNLNSRIFEKILLRENISKKFHSQDKIARVSEQLRDAYKERFDSFITKI
ncbi:uncharacterized protein LOC106694238 [Microplitis demolitor]|uniref:uncharacterized protein LOC106694238 n=1 Tax=Microplitis demolitor TaxID=69319 RepID=UPI0006D523BC|nr:uncharacterized protein LOC106694238 [Microplitis demolitor]